VDIVAKKQGAPHLEEERQSRLNWRHEFQNDCADRCGLMLAGRTGQTIRTLTHAAPESPSQNRELDAGQSSQAGNGALELRRPD